MAFPKITWNDGAGHCGTVLFQLPPVQHPYVWVEAVRTDKVSTAGVKQSCWFRNDEFFDLNLQAVQLGDEIASFDGFMRNCALQGGEFNYYPDADINQFTTYTLEGTTWKPAFMCFQYFKFQLQLRKVVQG
jgi:hypothetical protein